jgi:hypothetical protein
MSTSSSIKLIQTLEWGKKFVFQRQSVIGNYLEPAISSANTILQTILGAPFSWRWNRVITGFICTIGQQDYTIFNWKAATAVTIGYVLVDSNGNSQAVTTAGTTGSTLPSFSNTTGNTTSDGTAVWTNKGNIGIGVSSLSQTYSFGWTETASVKITNANTGQLEWKEISSELCLALESAQSRPSKIAAQIDSGDGNITFRLMPVPDKAYPVSITMQQKPPLFTGTQQTWSPIPDEYSHIYNWGLLSLLFLFADDPRFQMANQKFVAHLLSASQGLTETQINIWLSRWQQVTGDPMTKANTIQQGFTGRQAQ